MLGKLDIDNNTTSWLPAYKSFKNNQSAKCPICGSNDLEAVAKKLNNNIGYVLITCHKCGKSGYFSRVDFTDWKGYIT